MSQAEAINAQKYAASKGKYFSSADGRTYESYQAAVDAKKVRLASSKPNVSIPAAPQRPAPKVVVTNVQDQSAASNPGSGSGSDSATDCSIELSEDNDGDAKHLQACIAIGECDSDDRNTILIQITLIIHILHGKILMGLYLKQYNLKSY